MEPDIDPPRDPVSILADDILIEIFAPLDLATLDAAYHVSREWRAFFTAHELWRKRYLALPIDPPEKWRVLGIVGARESESRGAGQEGSGGGDGRPMKRARVEGRGDDGTVDDGRVDDGRVDDGRVDDGRVDDGRVDFRELCMRFHRTERNWAAGRARLLTTGHLPPTTNLFKFCLLGCDTGDDSLVYLMQEVLPDESESPLPALMYTLDRTTLLPRAVYHFPRQFSELNTSLGNAGVYAYANARMVGTHSNGALFMTRWAVDFFSISVRPSATGRSVWAADIDQGDSCSIERRPMADVVTVAAVQSTKTFNADGMMDEQPHSLVPLRPVLEQLPPLPLSTDADLWLPYVDGADSLSPSPGIAHLAMEEIGRPEAYLSFWSPDLTKQRGKIDMYLTGNPRGFHSTLACIDDDYAIITANRELHVYDRASGEHVLTYLVDHPGGDPLWDVVGVACSIPNEDRKASPEQPPGSVLEVALEGVSSDDPGYREIIDEYFWSCLVNEDIGGDTLIQTCKIFGTNLYLDTYDSALIIIPHYGDVFRTAAEQPKERRAGYVASCAYLFNYYSAFEFAAHGNRFMFGRTDVMFVFDVDALPRLPLAPGNPTPRLRALSIMGHADDPRFKAMMPSLGFKMDARAIYEQYDLGDENGKISQARSNRHIRNALRVWSFDHAGK